jgi:hypothetical protein
VIVNVLKSYPQVVENTTQKARRAGAELHAQLAVAELAMALQHGLVAVRVLGEHARAHRKYL